MHRPSSRIRSRWARRALPAVLAVAVAGTCAAGGAVAVTRHGARADRSATVAADTAAQPPASASAPSSPPASASGVAAGGSAGSGAVSGAAASRGQAEPRVAPLGTLRPPDVLLVAPGSLSSAQVTALRGVKGFEAVAVLDTAELHTATGTRHAVGADPSEVREFTPKLTARSDALWRSVARGEMTVSFTKAGALRPKLGDDVLVAAHHPAYVRLGAFASLGLPDTDVLVSHTLAQKLGFTLRHEVLVAAPHLTVPEIEARARTVLGPDLTTRRLRPQPDQGTVSGYARSRIPPRYLALYRAAARTCPGLPWEVLAAIGAVETGHGANTAVSSAGAMGPMQFLPSTFRDYGVDGDGDGVADINDPADAVYSAAHYLCMAGAGRGGQSLYDAIFAYNHADWYVREVAALAVRYQNG